MTLSTVANLEVALQQLLAHMETLPPFSERRRKLHARAEILRGLIRDLSEEVAA
jgi:hypothetical protein